LARCHVSSCFQRLYARRGGVFVYKFYFYHQGKEEKLLAITREKKEELVARYKEQVTKSPAIVFTKYQGATVAQVQALRTRLQEQGATYMVVKNTLLGIALKDADVVIPMSC